MTDIIDRIDALVDEQLNAGEAPGGYEEYGVADPDPDYPRCPHCGRHWHGLRITSRIAIMYGHRAYDPDYRVDEDDSEILCEGSEFIGPRRPTGWEQSQIRMTESAAGLRREIDFSVEINGVAQRGREMQIDIRQWLGAITTWANPFLNQVVAIRLGNTYRLNDPGRWWRKHCTPKPHITFGPQHWHHEVGSHWRRLEHARTHFPRPWPPIRTPLEHAILDHWDELTADPTPIPDRPGYDFAHLNIEPNHGPHNRQPVTDVPLPGGRKPATARARNRSGRRKS